MEFVKDNILINHIDYIRNWDTAYGADNITWQIIDKVRALPKLMENRKIKLHSMKFNIIFSNSGYEDTVQLYITIFESGFNLIDIRFPKMLQDNIGESIKQEILDVLCK